MSSRFQNPEKAAKQTAAARSYSKEGTRRMTAIVNGFPATEGTRKVMHKRVPKPTNSKAPQVVSVTVLDASDIPVSSSDRINAQGIREFEVDVTGAEAGLTAWFAQNAAAFAAGPTGGLDPVSYAIMERFFDPTNTVSDNKHYPALLKRKIYLSVSAEPAVLVSDIKMFKQNPGSAGLTAEKLKPGDLVDLHDASFCIYVCEPRARQSRDTIVYSMRTSRVSFSDRNFSGSLYTKLAAFFPPARQALCAIPADVLANIHLVVSSGNYPANGAILPGPAIYREEIIPMDPSVYFKAVGAPSLDTLPVREKRGERTISELFYQGNDPDAEVAARVTFPINLKLTWWREDCERTGITRDEDWVFMGARFPWRWTAIVRLDIGKIRSNDANKGDTKALYDSLGTLEGRMVAFEIDFERSLQDGVTTTALQLKNGDGTTANPLHVEREKSPVINLNEYHGEIGGVVEKSRIYAVCNKLWTAEQLALLKSLPSNAEREAVLRQTPDCAIPFAADEPPLKWLLYAITPSYAEGEAPASLVAKSVPKPISLI
jgi:hypothetical protein